MSDAPDLDGMAGRAHAHARYDAAAGSANGRARRPSPPKAPSGPTGPADLLELHAGARQVLAELLIDRDQSESRTQVAGQADPIRQVTGVSALDRAVDETRTLLARIEAAAGTTGDPSASPRSFAGSSVR